MQDSLSSQQNQTSQTGLVGKFELKTLTPNHPVGYIVHDTLTASPRNDISPSVTHQTTTLPLEKEGGKRKRTRRAKSCKDKEQAEIQRITHIAVERNRRKMMNEHLEILKSIMPESYIHRGDQASIVGGAIEYVKALEHLLQTLEVQKLLVATASTVDQLIPPSAPFSQFFSYPQYTFTTEENNAGDNNSNINTDNCTVTDNNYNYTTTSSSTRSNDVADIEVSLIETRANVRIFSRRNFLQLSKLAACFQSISLSILHLNVTTLDPMVLYSISAKLCKPGRQGTFTTTASASVSLSTSSFLRLKKSANSAQRMK